MPTPEELNDLANAPKRTTTEEGTVEEHDLKEVIEMDKYLKGAEASDAGVPWGIRVARSKPCGTVPPSGFTR